MGHGIKKETYVDADEQTTKALTFDLLDNLDGKMEEMTGCHAEHIDKCDKRFDKIEKKKKRDTVVSSASGVIGGFLAILVLQIKEWFK